MTVEILFSAVKTFGLPVALLLFMLWQDSKRKEQDRKDREALLKRIEGLEDYQKGKLAQISIESATAMQNNSETNKEMLTSHRAIAESMKQLTLAIRTRPCLEAVVNVMERDAS